YFGIREGRNFLWIACLG
ncbi:tetraacyldisaccharide 4'-kinase domain protein, partial [Chlamydia psittaci 84-8471/1]